MIRKFLEKIRCPIASPQVTAALTWFLGLKGKKGSAAGGTND
jgi:hypothetical protein